MAFLRPLGIGSIIVTVLFVKTDLAKSFAVKEKKPQSFRERDRNNAIRCVHLASFTDTVYKDQKWQTSQ